MRDRPTGNFPLPPDESVRRCIREDLDANFLVEAGAGSGKTTALVDRMVALVRHGACKVEHIAAVTFTRKAAAELRQRFQVELERAGARRNPDDPERERVEEALQNLDSAFLGTIHSFCAKLLRERPLEAGLDPGFREVMETEAVRLQKIFWIGYLERLAADGSPQLRKLDELGIRPEQLEDLYGKLVDNPDVEFDSTPVRPPDQAQVEAVRAQLDALLDWARALLPNREPEKGWDSLAKKVRTLLYQRRAFGWKDRTAFFDALTKLHQFKGKPIQKRWSDDPARKRQVKQLGEAAQAFGDPAGQAGRLLNAWWAYRYPIAVSFAKGAADAFAEERKELGQVTFQDELVLAAELLRNSPSARRELARRYRRILVDEFQDTDPLQAEIVFLLASEPSVEDDRASDNDWTRARPRPGALFVVGDPKQSIYRFRRADIALYELVKQRFREFGEVLRLQANFRSLKCIERVVKGVFDSEQMFPAGDQPQQAAFAPLLAQRDPAMGCEPGVLRSYAVRGDNQDQVAEDDAKFIAAHIAGQIASGARKAGEFMVLTPFRKHLALYARVLEEWSLPVEVSGAGVDFEDKLSAFLLLFKCMADPAHEVRVLGVLAGPFFGVTLDEIVAYRDAGGKLAANRPPWVREGGEGAAGSADAPHVASVFEALDKLHGWWKLARREPADVTAERLAAETGLFPLAAAGPLGQLRAGALVYLLDAVRAQALAGDASLAGAVEAMETALEWSDAVVSLVPGRGNAVQVMNLHQAKGLEANVVFLGSPFGENNRPPTMRVDRGDDGVARGVMPVGKPGQFGRMEVIARPHTWEEHAKVEAEFETAEKVRLLYVATTRARDELWVARWEAPPRRSSKSPWAAVERWIAQEAKREAGDLGDGAGEGQVAARLEIVGRPEAPHSEALDPETELAAEVKAAEAAVKDAGTPTYRLRTATSLARGDEVEASDFDDSSSADTALVAADAPAETSAFPVRAARPLSGGPEWGTVVHKMLSAVEEGEGKEVLAARARNLLISHERRLDDNGNPRELDALLTLVDDVARSEVWARATASQERYTEVPFALGRGGGPDDQPEVLEGVIDLVFREDDGWVVADYKNDTGTAPGFPDRVPEYKAQVDLYAKCWEQITSEPVVERMLVFTTQGRVESW